MSPRRLKSAESDGTPVQPVRQKGNVMKDAEKTGDPLWDALGKFKLFDELRRVPRTITAERAAYRILGDVREEIGEREQTLTIMHRKGYGVKLGDIMVEDYVTLSRVQEAGGDRRHVNALMIPVRVLPEVIAALQKAVVMK